MFQENFYHFRQLAIISVIEQGFTPCMTTNDRTVLFVYFNKIMYKNDRVHDGIIYIGESFFMLT